MSLAQRHTHRYNSGMRWRRKVQYIGALSGIWAAIVLLANIWRVSTMISEEWPIIRAFLPPIGSTILVASGVWLVITAWEPAPSRAGKNNKETA